MKYLVVGSGGREHAIAWRLIDDGSAQEVLDNKELRHQYLAI